MFTLTFLTLPDTIITALIGMFGCIIGSFLNVVIYRVPQELSVVYPNSACPKCEKPIKFYDNIPVLSWIMLGGKCRVCKNRISARYPAVELGTGIVFAMCTLCIGFNPFLPVALVFAACIIALIFIDAEHMILPDVITFPMIAVAIICRIAFPLLFGADYLPDLNDYPINVLSSMMPLPLASLAGGIIGGLAGGGSLWLVGEIWKRLRGVDAMGFGDVKMMFGIGFLLGWQLAVVAIFLGAFSGAVIGVAIISRQKDKDLQTMIPFGIFLGIGSIISMLAGKTFLLWYIETFIPR